jgi:hypothetical protein
MMKVVNVLLAVGILAAGYFLFKSIEEPIVFNKAKKTRYDDVQQKLTYIKDLQLAYKDIYGKFSGTFDSLAIFVQQDSMKITKVIGDPDQLDVYGKPVPVTYEISKIPAKDSLMNPKFDVTDLATLPNVEGEKFDMAASIIEKGRVMVPVFEVSATNEQILKGLQKKYIDPNIVRKVGSMTEPNYNGNW